LCVLLLVSFAGQVLAQSPSEQEKQAYCHSVQDQADAERLLDTGLEAYGRLGQPDTQTAKSVVVGVQKSLSKHLQGLSATRTAQLECTLYRETLDVDRATKFTTVAIDQQVATQRVAGLKEVLRIVDEEIEQTQKRRSAGDATVADVLGLTDRRAALFTQLESAELIAAQVIPDWTRLDLAAALGDIDQTTLELQDELNHKQILQSWDVALVGGVMKPYADIPDQTSMRTQPFVALTVTYNLNARAYRRRLDASTASLLEMRHAQNDELYQRVSLLETGMARELVIEEGHLPTLEAESVRLADEYAHLQAIESPEGWRMRTITRISLAAASLELRLSRLRIKLLTESHARHQ
jgi:hypothetical protein